MKTAFVRTFFGVLAALPSFAHTVFYRMETLQNKDGHQVVLVYDWHRDESHEQEQTFIQNLLQTLPHAMVYVEDPANHAGPDNNIKTTRFNRYQTITKLYNQFLPHKKIANGLHGLTYRLRDHHVQTQSIECRFGYQEVKYYDQIKSQDAVDDLQETMKHLECNNTSGPFALHISSMLKKIQQRDTEFYNATTLTNQLKEISSLKRFIGHSLQAWQSLNADQKHQFYTALGKTHKETLLGLELVDLLALQGIQNAAYAQKPAIIIAGGYHCFGISHTLQKIAGYRFIHSIGCDENNMPGDSAYAELYPHWFNTKKSYVKIECTPLCAEQISKHFSDTKTSANLAKALMQTRKITQATPQPTSTYRKWLTPKYVATACLGLTAAAYLAYR